MSHSANKGIPRFRLPLNPQPITYTNAEAKQGAEQERRKELLAWHEQDAQRSTLSESERRAIWERVRGAKFQRGVCR